MLITTKKDTLPCIPSRAPKARIKYKLRSRFKKTGSMYLGFFTLREKKVSPELFPSVFCEVRTHLVGKTAGFATGYKNSPALPMRPN